MSWNETEFTDLDIETKTTTDDEIAILYGRHVAEDLGVDVNPSINECLVACFYNACKNGYLSIVQHLVSHPLINAPAVYASGIEYARNNGHNQIMGWIIDNVEISRFSDLKVALNACSITGHNKIFIHLLEDTYPKIKEIYRTKSEVSAEKKKAKLAAEAGTPPPKSEFVITDDAYGAYDAYGEVS